MKAERQQKESQKAALIQSKQERSKLSFVDNRPQAVSQNKFIESIGENALRLKGVLQDLGKGVNFTQRSSDTIQRVVYPNMNDMWAAVAPNQALANIMAIIQGNPELNNAYESMIPSLPSMNFVRHARIEPEANLQRNGDNTYNITYGPQETQRGDFANDNLFVGAILHEMMHIHAALTYQTHVPHGVWGHGANMNLPTPILGEEPDMNGFTDSQCFDDNLGVRVQVEQMVQNWELAREEVDLDCRNGTINRPQKNLLNRRIDYAEANAPYVHYDTVLMDVLYYLEGNGLQASRVYEYATRMLQEANIRRRAAAGAVVAIPRAPIRQQVAPAGEGCYLTTACVTYKDLPDDCEELTLLRYFRDTYLINKPNGKDLIAMYYARAPYVLANIHKRGKEEEDTILENIYGIVRECVDAILNGDNEFAFRTYCDMVVRLDSEYGN